MKFIFRVGPIYMFVADKASKTCAADGVPKGLQFLAGALGGQFHPAVRKVPHGADDFKAGSHDFRGIAKTDTLHLA